MKEKEHVEPATDDIVKQKLADHISDVPIELFEQIIIERNLVEPSADIVIKNKLLDHSSPLPSGMFENIMSARDTKQPKTIWWHNGQTKWAVLTLIILIMLLGYKLWNTYKTPDVIINPNTVSIPKVPVDKAITHGSTKNSLSAPQENKYDLNIASVLHQEVADLNSDKHLNQNINNINQKNINQKLRKHKISSISTSVNKTSTFNKADIQVSDSTKITSNFSQPTFNPYFSTSDIAEFSTTKSNSATTSDLQLSKNSHSISNLPVLSKSIALPSLSHDNVVKALPCPMPDGCPTFSSRKWRKSIWYVDVYGAPEYAFRRLEANSLEYNDYKNSRDTTEMTQHAFSAGIRATTLFRNGFLLRGGIVYAQTNEKFQKDSFGIGNIRYVIDKNPTTGRLDTVQIDITEGIFRTIRYNHYRTLDFTVQGGYEFTLTDKLTIGMNGGVNINIKTDIKAVVLDQTLQPLAVSKDKSIYQSSVGSSAIGTLAAYYQFSPQCQFLIEPQVRYYFKPISKLDYVIRQNYTNLGLNIGIRYRL